MLVMVYIVIVMLVTGCAHALQFLTVPCDHHTDSCSAPTVYQHKW